MTEFPGFYVASEAFHGPMWRAFKDAGYPITSTWIHESGVGETDDFADLWTRCIKEAAGSRCLLVYRLAGEQLKGGFVEVGAALAAGKKVVAVGCDDQSFVNHPNVVKHTNLAAGLYAAKKLSQEATK